MSTPAAADPDQPAYIAPPDWFLRAVAAPATSHGIASRGTELHVRCWNAHESAKPVLLFVHGYRGHSHWWDAIAPFFVERYRVAAMDFAGMGKSGRRAAYGVDSFTEDLIDILAAGWGPATVVGHSYGGGRTLRACAERPDLIRHAIILDSMVRFLGLDVPSEPKKIGSPRPFASYAAARARYRLLPEQPILLPYAVEHVAFHSIAQGPEGWHWAFDPALPWAPNESDGAGVLARIDLPVDFVRGASSSVVTPARAQRTVAQLRHGRGPVVIPEAHHHLMLDQPLALVAALHALLADRRA